MIVFTDIHQSFEQLETIADRRFTRGKTDLKDIKKKLFLGF